MEIKWGALKGGFAPKSYLKKLNKKHKGKLGEGATISPVPDSWQSQLKRFEYAGFSWQRGDRSGNGVMLHCGECSTVSVIHFYPEQDAGSHIPCEEILSSFQDHHRKDEVPLRIFGLQAVIPSEFSLTSHRFEAGVAELDFGNKHQRIRLFRWGPASVLLARQDLDSLARDGLDLPKTGPGELTVGDHQGLQWLGEPALTGKLPFLARMAKRPQFERICLWHVKERNRILGAVFSGRRPIEDIVMDRVLAGYETT